MAIKSILVAYSGEATNSGGLNLALLMARKHGAHVTGVVSHGPSLMESQYQNYIGAAVRDILVSRDEGVVAELRGQFEARVAEVAGELSAEFLDLRTHTGFTLTECARTYDLVVMGRRASEPGREHFGVRPEKVALNGGRPVLLVPRDYQDAQLNEHALVAWDGTRAAARALSDAMHIIGAKEKVTVLTVDRGDADPDFCDSVMDLLGHHGVPAERVFRKSGSASVSSTILQVCREVGAGLLVMGAYEHSVVSETLFGGVTKDIMGEANLPVLMSH